MSKVYILTLFLFTLPLCAAQDDEVIYGQDDRRDLHTVSTPLYLNIAQATAAMIPTKNLKYKKRKKYYKAKTKCLGHQVKLCKGEHFRKQRTLAHCSGFLVAENLLLTAGHCLEQAVCNNDYAWVFGFHMQNDKQKKWRFPAQDVFFCHKVIEWKLNAQQDYALIQLNGSSSRTPLDYRQTGQVEANEPLVMVGNPLGLPTKISAGAHVRHVEGPYSFRANLDAFAGNSGSVVVNDRTGLVEGILVGGEDDFVRSPDGKNCFVSKRCANDSCSGEQVMLVTQIKALQNSFR